MTSAILADIAEINPSGPENGKIAKDTLVDFIPMAAVHEDGTIAGEEQRQYGEVAKGFTPFKKNDLLVAKITPCFENNKISLANVKTNFAFGSTEFHVIRCKEDVLCNRYLYYFLRQDSIRRLGVKRMTGSAGQKRVPRKFLEQLVIPLPPLEEQHLIVKKLDQADELRKLRKRSLDKLSQLAQSAFYKKFGDGFSSNERYPQEKLGELCTLVRGSSPRPKGDPRYYGGEIPRLMISDITRDGMFVTPTTDSLTIAGAKKSRQMEKGSVVMAVSGAVGLPSILTVDACIHDGFVGFRELDSKVRPIFLYCFLLFQRRRSVSKGVGAIWSNLTTHQVKDFTIIVPSLKEQKEFEDLVLSIDDFRKAVLGRGALEERLFRALEQEAFCGEL